MKVLVVDDNPDHRFLTRRAAAAWRAGTDVLTAGGGAEALQLAAEAHPDLVLLDVKMPGMDGFEVLRRLRGEAGTADLRVVMFSSSDAESDATRAAELGASAFVTKPIDPASFSAVVKATLTRWAPA